MSEIDDKVRALEFELSQVRDHPGEAFRARAEALKAEIADWLTPGAPDEVPPSEHVDEHDVPVEPPVVEPAATPAKNAKPAED